MLAAVQFMDKFDEMKAQSSVPSKTSSNTSTPSPRGSNNAASPLLHV